MKTGYNSSVQLAPANRALGLAFLAVTAVSCGSPADGPVVTPDGGGASGATGTAGGSAGGSVGAAGATGTAGGSVGAAGATGTAGGTAGGSVGAAGATGTAGGSAGGSVGAAGATGTAGRAAGGSGGAAAAAGSSGTGVVAAGVRWIGRVDLTNPQQPRFAWSGTGFVARFSGTALAASLNNGGGFLFKAVVDGVPTPVFTTTSGQGTYDLAKGLAAGVHTVELYRQTEGGMGDSQLLALTVVGGALMAPPAAPARLIEVVGDSISAGYGNLGKLTDADCFPTESHWDAYGSVAARALGAEVSTIASSGHGIYRNYGGDMVDLMPAVYDRSLTNHATPKWDFRLQTHAVVINLGTNDISNGKGDPGMPFRNAYRDFVQTVRAQNPNAWIVCLIAPLLSGADLTAISGHIKAVVDARVAGGDTRIELFDKIAPQTQASFACQYHPNVAENKLMGDQLAAELRTRLGW
jgi:lysophospholipase L1-like esterase